MYPVSQRYKELMQAQFRESQSLARIYLGVFDASASSDATLSYPAATAYSYPVNVNKDVDINISYATFEGHYFRLDGKQMLLPQSTAAFRPQGWVSAVQSNADGVFETPPQIMMDFSIPHTMVGLTLTFGTVEEDVPAQLTIISYLNGQKINEQTVSDGLEPVYKGEFLLEDVDGVILRFDRTKGPYGRARLNHIEFGIGYSFQGNDIIKITEKHTDSPVSTALPSSSLSFDLRNTDNRFGVDSDTALVRFFADNQKVQLDYGLNVDGTPEWVTGGRWTLATWKTNGETASFTAEDILTRLTKSTYEKSIYDFKWHQLDDLARAVLEDAGITDYYLDPYLNRTSTQAPLPITSHAAALQLIANRGRCRLFVDRDGRISIERLTIYPEFQIAQQSSTRYTYYSDPASVLNGTATDYATFEPEYFRLDGSMLLLPENDGQRVPDSGMTSTEQADDSGNFSAAGSLVWYVSTPDPTNIYSVTFGFAGQIPAQIGITAYKDGEWLPWQYFSPSSNRETFEVNFQHVTTLEAAITKARKGGQRGHFSCFSANNVSDFVISKNQIFKNPKSEMATKLKSVTSQWIWRSYYPGVRNELASTKMNTNQGWVKINHDIAKNPQVEIDDASVSVEAKHYAYVSYVKLTSATDKEVKITITGDKIAEIEHPIAFNVSETGEDLPVENPLFDAENSIEVLKWMASYYSRREKHEVSMRGYPERSCGDYAYLWDGSDVQITGTNLVYNGAFNEDFTIRK